MNRVSRRSAAEAADALLEVGRTEPVLDYDVEVGLARHHAWLRNEAPLPEWASTSVGAVSQSWMGVAIKTIVSAVVVGAIATAAWQWQARERLQPSAAEAKPVERPQVVAPTVQDVAVSESPKPIPVSEPALPAEHPVKRAVADKRAARLQRSHKSARAEPQVSRAEEAVRLEPAAAATSQAAEQVGAEPAARPEVAAAAPERKAANAAQKAHPEPGQRPQEPDDLLEMQQVATAEQLLERSPERALALARQGDHRFAHGYFQQERAYIAIMALIRLGRMDEARTRAASFAKQFPPLPYGARIRSALDAAARP